MAKTFWRLRYINSFSAGLELKRHLPELKGMDGEILGYKLDNTKLDFYESEQATTPLWIRLTLPFAFIIALVLFLGMPINYIITGRWGYKIVWLKNWLSALGF